MTRAGYKLMASVAGNLPQELFPETETQFFWQTIRGRLIFVKDDNGEVSEIMFDQGITLGHAKRIKDAPAGSGK